jgi:hypothetical protein
MQFNPLIKEQKMSATRRMAILVGILFIMGTVSGILSGVFTGPVLDNPDYLVNISANNNQVLVGVLFVLIMGFALAMIPVMLFPIFRKYNEALAVGSVVFRGALETVAYIIMAVSWLLLINLGQEYVKAGMPEGSHFQTLGTLLMGVNQQINPILEITFSLGALMIYYLFFQSRLIPRWLSGWGLLGALVYLATGLLSMFGVDLEFLLYLLALQEMVLALWLIIRGFTPPAVSQQFTT